MALIGTISGSNGTSTTAISGSVIIADRPPGEFPSLPPNAKFYVSGTRDVNGPLGAIGVFGGDVFVTGGLGVSDYVQMLPVNELRIPTNTSASYIYTSGSTNDLYFTQYSGPYTNTTRLRWLEGSLSTGLLHGGILSTQNGTTTFSITSGSGIIVYQNATTSSDPYPTIRFVKWPTYVSQSLQYSGSAQITYVAIDPDGDIEQSPIAFNTEQFKDRVVLGRVLHQSGSVTNGATNTPTTAYAVTQNTNDFVRAFGPLKISGHYLSASGSSPTLSIVKTAGTAYVEGRNYSSDPNNPNIIDATADPEVTISKIYREYVSGSTPIIDTGIANAGYTTLNPGLYNDNGTLASVGNGEFTIQRVFWFPRAVNRAFFVYYGSAKYPTMDDAIAGIGVENFIEGGNTAGSAILVAYICLKGDASDLLTASQARIYQGGLFRGSSGASFGGAGGGASLPGGLDTYVQFNDDNTFGGESGFTFNKLTNSATLVGDINAANANLSGNVNAAVASITGNAYASGTLYAKDVSIFGNLTVTSGSTVISGSGDVSIQSQTGSINIGTDTTNSPSGSENVTIPNGTNNTFTGANGTLSSINFPSPYPANSDGYTVFQGIPGVYRRITGVIQTESSFDPIRVYDGSGTGGTLLYTQSGNLVSFSFTSGINQTFTVRFTSDAVTQLNGFTLTVTGFYAQNITIGGGTSPRTISIGNVSNTYPLLLSGGLGGIALTTDGVAGNINITNTSTGVLNLFNDSGTGDVNVVGASAFGPRSINIGTGGVGAKTITIGSNASVASSTSITGGGIGGVNIATAAVSVPVNIATSTTAGTVSVGTGTSTQTLNFGTGAGTKTVAIGSSTGGSSLSLQSGTGALNIGTAATNKIITIGQTANTSNLALNGGSGGITISTSNTSGQIVLSNAGTGNIQLGNDAGTGNIDIGSGASATGSRFINVGTGGTGAKTVNIGNNTVAGSTTTINGGTTGGINIATAAIATPVNIANNTTAGTVNVGTGSATQTLNFGTGAGAKTVNIGSINTTSTTVISGGTGGIFLTTDGTVGPITIGGDASTGGIAIAGTASTGARNIFLGTGGTGAKTISIGNNTVANSSTTIDGGTTGGINIATAAVATPVNIANNTTAGTVNVGTGSATQTLNFGTGDGAKTVTVGSRTSTSTTLINAGTGGVTISSGSTTASSIGNDVFFYVSGNIATKPATSPDYTRRGTSVFGGDVVISGTLFGGSPLQIGSPLSVEQNIVQKGKILGNNSIIDVPDFSSLATTTAVLSPGTTTLSTEMLNSSFSSEGLYILNVPPSQITSRVFSFFCELFTDASSYLEVYDGLNGTGTLLETHTPLYSLPNDAYVIEPSLTVGPNSTRSFKFNISNIGIPVSVSSISLTAYRIDPSAYGDQVFIGPKLQLGSDLISGSYGGNIELLQYGDVKVVGDLSVGGNSIKSSNGSHVIEFTNLGLSITANTSLFVSGNTYLGNQTTDRLFVTGTSYFKEPVNLTSNLIVSGVTYLGNDTSDRLFVTGTSYFKEPVHITSNLIVSGVTYLGNDTSDRLFVTGTSYFKEPSIFTTGITGSLTKLNDGTDYIRAGANITVSTGSSGAVTIAGVSNQAITFPATTFSGGVTTVTLTVPGARITDAVSVGYGTALQATMATNPPLVWQFYVPAADSVRFQVWNPGNSVSTAASTVYISLMK